MTDKYALGIQAISLFLYITAVVAVRFAPYFRKKNSRLFTSLLFFTVLFMMYPLIERQKMWIGLSFPGILYMLL
jgi:hypothetical protein